MSIGSTKVDVVMPYMTNLAHLLRMFCIQIFIGVTMVP
jgi:hypothetical protein